jgi:hypothetical protein
LRPLKRLVDFSDIYPDTGGVNAVFFHSGIKVNALGAHHRTHCGSGGSPQKSQAITIPESGSLYTGFAGHSTLPVTVARSAPAIIGRQISSWMYTRIRDRQGLALPVCESEQAY